MKVFYKKEQPAIIMAVDASAEKQRKYLVTYWSGQTIFLLNCIAFDSEFNLKFKGDGINKCVGVCFNSSFTSPLELQTLSDPECQWDHCPTLVFRWVGGETGGCRKGVKKVTSL